MKRLECISTRKMQVNVGGTMVPVWIYKGKIYDESEITEQYPMFFQPYKKSNDIDTIVEKKMFDEETIEDVIVVDKETIEVNDVEPIVEEKEQEVIVEPVIEKKETKKVEKKKAGRKKKK